VSGRWQVRKVNLPSSGRIALDDDRPDCFRFRPGGYTELCREGVTFMTDLHDEWWTQRAPIERALATGGEVLVTGLGLGLVVDAMLDPGSPVDRVTIVEAEADVIALVGPWLSARHPGRIEIVHADAYRWQPASGRRWRTVWHDIWPDPLATDVDTQMAALDIRYAPHADWQGHWPLDYRAALTPRHASRSA
jgi:hypothetical protein